MVKKIVFLVIMFLIAVLLFFNFGMSNLDNTNIEVNENISKHNGVLISDLLSEDNYNKVGINPDKYDDFKGFLEDFKTFTGVLVDPINEKFVIGLNNSEETILYIPFDFKNSGDNFDNSENKNLAILDIFKSYKEDLIYGGIDSDYGSKILFEKDLRHPKTDILIDIINVDINDNSNNINDIINTLENSNNSGISNKELLAYLYDFTGNYSDGNEQRDKICKINEASCDKKIKVHLEGKVKDTSGKGVGGVKVTLLNDDNYFVVTDREGNYSLDFEKYNFTHLRFKASAIGYSDGFATHSLNNIYNNKIYLDIDIEIQKSENMVVINEFNEDEFIKGIYYVVEDDNSKYFIPRNGLYYFNGDKYEGKNISIYTYLFTKTTSSESMLANDTFEPVYGYIGNIMKTFGMPYIQFVDNETNEELFIKSSNPMVLQNSIYHMKELYENSDEIYEALTDDDMEFLVQKSEEIGGYPIDFEFLIQNQILRWPAWWVLDRKTGVWGNIGSRVINTDGLVELPFYSIKD